MKKELLAPAGNFECLKSAVHNGADAVYLGGKHFGARAYASNFTDEEMLDAISYCHLYGVKIYVTVNTMIYETELKDALKYVGFLYENHVDAIIMADLGLMKCSLETYPDLEIHASTQAHTHNVEQIKFLKKMGVQRIVAARENSLTEINEMAGVLEIEAFIHGSLCISYSGQCLFSSLLLGRSGNRGECAQVCRLPYELYEEKRKIVTDGNYLLSTKDLNTSPSFIELMKSSVVSFKIEGRMKSPAYVGFVTKMYRNMMDQFENNQTIQVSSDDQKKAQVLFSRGFTEGKLFSKKENDFMNQKTQNHQGVRLGEVIEISQKKIKILLSDDLHQEDGIRFSSDDKGMIVNYLYNMKDNLVSSAKKGEMVYLDNRLLIKEKGIVLKTLDSVLEKSLVVQETKRIPVTLHAAIANESGITLTLSDAKNTVSVTRDWVQKALKIPTSEESVTKQLRRFGDTIFELSNLTIEMEKDIFINIAHLNEVRRLVSDALMEARIKRNPVRIFEVVDKVTSFSKSIPAIFVSATSEEQIEALLSCNVNGIYVDDIHLYEKYIDSPVIFKESRIHQKENVRDVASVLIGETGDILRYPNVKKIGDSYLNVSNHATVELLLKESFERLVLSIEMDISAIETLLKKYPFGNPFEFILYGRPEVMVIQHCILKQNVNHDKICKVCKEPKRYFLKDRNDSMYPIVMDSSHRTHLFYHKTINYIGKIKEYLEIGLRNFRLDFVDETPEEIMGIVNEVKNKLHFDLQKDVNK